MPSDAGRAFLERSAQALFLSFLQFYGPARYARPQIVGGGGFIYDVAFRNDVAFRKTGGGVGDGGANCGVSCVLWILSNRYAQAWPQGGSHAPIIVCVNRKATVYLKNLCFGFETKTHRICLDVGRRPELKSDEFFSFRTQR